MICFKNEFLKSDRGYRVNAQMVFPQHGLTFTLSCKKLQGVEDQVRPTGSRRKPGVERARGRHLPHLNFLLQLASQVETRINVGRQKTPASHHSSIFPLRIKSNGDDSGPEIFISQNKAVTLQSEEFYLWASHCVELLQQVAFCKNDSCF